MKRENYQDNWREISLAVRDAAKWACELCGALNALPHSKTGSMVVLTVHHIDGNRKNNLAANLIALCQRCHLRLDRGLRSSARFARASGELKS